MSITRLQPIRLGTSHLQFALLVPFMLLFLVAFVGILDCWGYRKPVSLPFATSAAIRDGSEHDVTITLQLDRMAFIDSKWYPATELQQKVVEIAKSRRSAPHFVLRVDRSLPFSVLRQYLAMLSAAGARRVTLVTFEGVPLSLLIARAAA